MRWLFYPINQIINQSLQKEKKINVAGAPPAFIIIQIIKNANFIFKSLSIQNQVLF